MMGLGGGVLNIQYWEYVCAVMFPINVIALALLVCQDVMLEEYPGMRTDEVETAVKRLSGRQRFGEHREETNQRPERFQDMVHYAIAAKA
jgi:hypothetical protein